MGMGRLRVLGGLLERSGSCRCWCLWDRRGVCGLAAPETPQRSGFEIHRAFPGRIAAAAVVVEGVAHDCWNCVSQV